MSKPEKIIVICPVCQKQVKIEELHASNTAAAKFWTDGKMEAPLIPEQSDVMTCPHGSHLFWKKEAQEHGREPYKFFVKSRYSAVPYANVPSLEDLMSELQRVRGKNKEHEIYLRMRIWWADNQTFRRNKKDKPINIIQLAEKWLKFKKKSERLSTLNDQESGRLENMRRLLVLLDNKEPEIRLIRAELYRELGEFKASLEELKTPVPDYFQAHADTIKRLAQQEKEKVALIKIEKENKESL
ncbi:hypothetical protein GF406_17130 [candidate division KSB1 bacterium]|nr:hypothetical protein [candidate division KSB1 bacterium]